MNKITNDNIKLLDNHLIVVGKLIVNAAACDAILFSTFKIISNCSHKIAIAIYYSSESLQPKRTLINRITKANNDKDEEKLVEKIIKSLQKANNQRNELSHALLKIHDQNVFAHNLRREENQKKQLTEKYLASLVKNSHQAVLQANELYNQLCQKRGIPPTVDLEYDQ